MDLALYHPEYGYYTAAGDKMGWKGDYYTSSNVHPVFGELIAKQLVQMDHILSEASLTLVEMGAGKGILCHDILQSIQKEFPSTYRRLHYLIIEKSLWLKQQQIAWLSPLFQDRVRWSDDVPEGMNGIIFSNELIDAFPVHRIQMGQGLLQEVYVDWREDQFVEVTGVPSTPKLQDYVERIGIHFDTPVYLEINLLALDWMKKVGEALHRGFVLTIDYGYPAEALYTPHRPRGTFLCYHKHQVNENPYHNLGEQDMTSHVDFTSLAQAGRDVGLTPLGFTDQTHFLMGLGIAQRMEVAANKMDSLEGSQSAEDAETAETAEAARKEFLAMKHLMDPGQMGRMFKVLIQGKGVPEKPPLDGLHFRPFVMPI